MKKTKKEIIKVIDEIESRIITEKNCIESEKNKLKNTSDQETIQLLNNSIRAHRISLITLEDLLKSITINAD